MNHTTDFLRPGARVIVQTPQGSRWDGWFGTIESIDAATAMVRLDDMRAFPIPFARGELVSKSSVVVATKRAAGG